VSNSIAVYWQQYLWKHNVTAISICNVAGYIDQLHTMWQLLFNLCQISGSPGSNLVGSNSTKSTDDPQECWLSSTGLHGIACLDAVFFITLYIRYSLVQSITQSFFKY
jgi:hypothetical protein